MEAGHTVRHINVRRADILDQIRGCDGFMWRFAHTPEMRQIARRLLPVLQRELNLEVYPDQSTCWHFDDKVAQYQLLVALGLPTPQTWVWFEEGPALEFAKAASYPLVLKLATGAGSSNVRLLWSARETADWIRRLFSGGVRSCDEVDGTPLPLSWARAKGTISLIYRGLREASRLALTGLQPAPTSKGRGWEFHRNYVLLQEFIRGNAFDTRITVIGDRAFAFRRFNRDHDFRASGSGKIDHDPSAISQSLIQLAFEAAKKLGMQSCAFDFLWRGEDAMICEISYTYASWAVHDCPGHWNRQLVWQQGRMWPEEAQASDFLQRLQARVAEGRELSG